jgi:RNase H-fold protein (predicted Holliday junction resolvase)
MVILGISVGTRSSGIAVLEGGKLTAWNTLSFKDGWSESKGDQIVGKYEKYLKAHKATVLVLKVPRISHHTEAILSLLAKIQDFVNRQGCMVQVTDQTAIKTAIPEIKNGKDLISHTAGLYPALAHEQSRELANRNKYHGRMFEAVLVAHLYDSSRLAPDGED